MGDSPKSEDRDGIGCPTGSPESLDSGCRGYGFSAKHLAKDRGKENGVGFCEPSALDLFEAVTGDRDERVRKAGRQVAMDDLNRSCGVVLGGQVDSVGLCCDCGIDVGVDEQSCSVRRDNIEDLASEIGERGGEQIFFAELDNVDSLLGP